jgi:hypothetical protein
MQGGDRLIEALKMTGRQWLVIHGHNHVPLLGYADASTLSPVILSSASVAAKTYKVRGRHARNQIHHVRIDLDDNYTKDYRIYGEVTSWTWADELGWAKAESASGMPYHAGFGYKPDMDEIRAWILEEANSAPSHLVRWHELISRKPRLRFLVPEHRDELISMLERIDGALVGLDSSGEPTMVEVRDD